MGVLVGNAMRGVPQAALLGPAMLWFAVNQALEPRRIRNIASVLVVQATIRFAIAILAEAGLSYLGLGTQPPTPSWGRMLGEGQSMMYQAPMLAVWPGLAIVLSVLGLNLMGDGLRDLLDPKLARQR